MARVTNERIERAVQGRPPARCPASTPAPASGPPAFDPAYAQQTVQPVASLTSAAELTPGARVEVGKRALAAPKAISEEAQAKAAAQTNYDLNVEVRADGSVQVIAPLTSPAGKTNSPPAK